MGRRSMKGRFAGGWQALALAIALSALAATPAQTTVRDRIYYTDHWSDSYDCGFPVEVTSTAEGRFLLREGEGPSDTTFPVLDTVKYRQTHTNTDTGESFVIRGHGIFNEVRSRQVDGTIFEFRAVQAGQPFVVEDPDGRVVMRDRGAVYIVYLFDTGGDDEPGGEWIADLDVRFRGNYPSLETNLCEIATELIG